MKNPILIIATIPLLLSAKAVKVDGILKVRGHKSGSGDETKLFTQIFS